MNKQELIDKAVHEFGGEWPSVFNMPEKRSPKNGFYVTPSGTMTHKDHCEWFKECEFTKRARELGYINGYRWGVEYPTNGKKPDLDSSILVYVVDCHAPYSKEAQVIDIHWPRYDTFEIIDQRYKPVDTSYLDAPTVKESLPDEWYDYDNQKAIALPPVGTECEAFLMDTSYKNAWFKVEVIKNHLDRECACMRIENRGLTWCNTFRPLNWNRKAEEKKRRVVDAAMKIASGGMTKEMYEALYDAGYLKLPE